MSSVRFLYLLFNTWRRFFQLWRAWTTKEQGDLPEHQHRRYWGHHLPHGRRDSCYENSFCVFFLFSKKRSPKGRRLLRKKRYSLCLLFGSKEIWFCHQEIYGTGALLHAMSHWRSGCHFLPFLKTIAAASSLLCALSLPSDNVPHCPTTWKQREETNLNNQWMSCRFIHT